jgi:hypothetical protein
MRTREQNRVPVHHRNETRTPVQRVAGKIGSCGRDATARSGKVPIRLVVPDPLCPVQVGGPCGTPCGSPRFTGPSPPCPSGFATIAAMTEAARRGFLPLIRDRDRPSGFAAIAAMNGFPHSGCDRCTAHRAKQTNIFMRSRVARCHPKSFRSTPPRRCRPKSRTDQPRPSAARLLGAQHDHTARRFPFHRYSEGKRSIFGSCCCASFAHLVGKGTETSSHCSAPRF